MQGNRSQAVHLHQALDRAGGDREFYRELLDMLLEDASEQVSEMKEGIEAGDAERVERVAHSLKGAAANLEAGPVRDAALCLEMLGREANLADAAGALVELEAELERLRHFAQELE